MIRRIMIRLRGKREVLRESRELLYKMFKAFTPLETVAYCYFDMKRFNEAIMSFRFHIESPHLNHMLVGQ